MTNTLVSLNNIFKTYGTGDSTTEVLKGLNLEIAKGDFVAIMGPSGSGKSTLMHTLGLLDRPTSGEYLLEGNMVNHLTDNELAELRNRKMGFVFQSFNLLARTSALENVELPLIYRAMSMAGRHELARTALTQVGLSHRLQHMPNQLSGGEQQRIAIARALIGDPEIIFADEPTGNLDTKNSIEIMKIFTKLNQAGKTIILVTHEDDIAAYAKRTIRLKDGVVVSDTYNNQMS